LGLGGREEAELGFPGGGDFRLEGDAFLDVARIAGTNFVVGVLAALEGSPALDGCGDEGGGEKEKPAGAERGSDLEGCGEGGNEIEDSEGGEGGKQVHLEEGGKEDCDAGGAAEEGGQERLMGVVDEDHAQEGKGNDEQDRAAADEAGEESEGEEQSGEAREKAGERHG
jgi:hypothetical protein